jgi:hypothetical protein
MCIVTSPRPQVSGGIQIRSFFHIFSHFSLLISVDPNIEMLTESMLHPERSCHVILWC